MNIAALFKRKPKTTEIEAALAALDLEGAQAQLHELETKRQAALLGASLDELQQLDSTIAAARLKLEQLATQKDALEARREALATEAAEAERRAQYEAAVRALEAGRDELDQYRKAALEIRATLARIARIDLAIVEANRNLPEGAAPLPAVEVRWRGLPIERTAVESEEVIGYQWRYTGAYAGWGEIEPELASKVEETSKNRGVIRGKNGPRPVERVLARRRRIRNGRDPYVPEPLAATVRLPGVEPGSRDLWQGMPYRFPAEDFALQAANVQATASVPPNAEPKDPRPESTIDFKEIYERLPGEEEHA